MAYKGTAAKSASGASMSKYDVEVEGRLQEIEKNQKNIAAELTWLKGKMEELTATGKTGPAPDGVADKLDLLISILKMNEKNSIEKLSKGRL